MKSEERRYFLKEHKPVGPYTLAQVIALWREQKLSPKETCRLEAEVNWRPVADLAAQALPENTGSEAFDWCKVQDYAAIILAFLGGLGLIGALGERMPLLALGMLGLLQLAVLLAIFSRLRVIAKRLGK